MTSVEIDLAALEAWWLALPEESRLRAAEFWGGAAVLFGEGCARVGPALGGVRGPLMSLFLTGVQQHMAAAAQAMLFRRPPPETNPVFEAAEARFPALVKFVEAMSGALGLAPAPAPLFPVTPPEEP